MTPKKKRSSEAEAPKPAAADNRFKSDAGELWIEPNLNRKIHGPGGNRGEHTTSTAELLKLADIALKENDD